MGRIIDRIIEKAKENKKTIILPEAEDARVLKAARINWVFHCCLLLSSFCLCGLRYLLTE